MKEIPRLSNTDVLILLCSIYRVHFISPLSCDGSCVSLIKTVCFTEMLLLQEADEEDHRLLCAVFAWPLPHLVPSYLCPGCGCPYAPG